MPAFLCPHLSGHAKGKAQHCLSKASRPQGMGQTLPDPTPAAPHKAPPSLTGWATRPGSHHNPGHHWG